MSSVIPVVTFQMFKVHMYPVVALLDSICSERMFSSPQKVLLDAIDLDYGTVVIYSEHENYLDT